MSAKHIYHLCWGLATAIAVVVLAGWLYGVDAVTHLRPEWVSMKVTTATAVLLVCMSELLRKREAACWTFALAAMVLVGSAMGAAASSTPIGNEPNPVMSIAEGIPSWGTMIALTLAVVGQVTDLHGYRIRGSLGKILVGVGVIAICGYIVSVPAMYYYFPELSTAMALHTAVALVCIGEGQRLSTRLWGNQ